MACLKRILRGDKGQDMVEYGLLAAFLSVVTIAALMNLSPLVARPYAGIHDSVKMSSGGGGGSGDPRGGGSPVSQ